MKVHIIIFKYFKFLDGACMKHEDIEDEGTIFGRSLFARSITSVIGWSKDSDNSPSIQSFLFEQVVMVFKWHKLITRSGTIGGISGSSDIVYNAELKNSFYSIAHVHDTEQLLDCSEIYWEQSQFKCSGYKMFRMMQV